MRRRPDRRSGMRPSSTCSAGHAACQRDCENMVMAREETTYGPLRAVEAPRYIHVHVHVHVGLGVSAICTLTSRMRNDARDTHQSLGDGCSSNSTIDSSINDENHRMKRLRPAWKDVRRQSSFGRRSQGLGLRNSQGSRRSSVDHKEKGAARAGMRSILCEP